MGTREEIKSEIIRAGFTVKEVVEILNKKYYRSGSTSNLSNKLSKDSLRYREAKEIAEVIGCKIVWVKEN